MKNCALDSFLERLAAVTEHEPRLGWKGWSARCPAHDDRHASLSIGIGEDGRVLVHCHANCSLESILAALGLKPQDLFDPAGWRSRLAVGQAVPDEEKQEKQRRSCQPQPDLPERGHCVPEGGASTAGTQPPQRTYPHVSAAIAALSARLGDPSEIYEYHHADGSAAGRVLRWNGANGKKDFRPLTRSAEGWVIGAMPAPRPLYALPDILRSSIGSDRVYMVEGEKAAEAAGGIGLLATTSAGGSNAAAATDFSPLAARNVVILPDNDAAGEKYAATVAGILLALRPRPIVRIVKLPGLPPAGDVVDFLHGRRSKSHLQLVGEIDALVTAVEPLTERDLEKTAANAHPVASPGPSGPAARLAPPSAVSAPASAATVVRLGGRKPAEVQWLWPGRVPLAKLTLLSGDPGLGKSMLTLDLAARVTRGRALPATDGELPVLGSLPALSEPASVVLLSAEDDVDDTIIPRLVGADADLDRVVALSAVRYRSALSGEERESMFNLATDLDVLDSVIAGERSCKLVIVDPISAYCGASDSHKNSDVRALLAPLAALAARRNIAVLAVNHLNKSNQGPAIYRSMGSLAFAAAARSVLAVMADPYDPSRRLCLSVKTNLSQRPPGIAFSVSQTVGQGNATGHPKIQWQRDSIADTADEVVTQATSAATSADGVGEACEWLASALADGPVAAVELKANAAEEGIAIRTLWRAKSRLGITARREGANTGSRFVWVLPDS